MYHTLRARKPHEWVLHAELSHARFIMKVSKMQNAIEAPLNGGMTVINPTCTLKSVRRPDAMSGLHGCT
jgi:hypothetical protein